jgi:hypothetical protein
MSHEGYNERNSLQMELTRVAKNYPWLCPNGQPTFISSNNEGSWLRPTESATLSQL